MKRVVLSVESWMYKKKRRMRLFFYYIFPILNTLTRYKDSVNNEQEKQDNTQSLIK